LQLVKPKKPLLILLLFFACINVYGQSVDLLDLTTLASLNSNQVEGYFSSGRVFKLQCGEDVNGFLVKHYLATPKPNKQETILTGAGYKSATGVVLNTISYVTNDPKNIINLINQTKTVGLKLTFQGADGRNNIYVYDSQLFHVVIKLSYNQTFGALDMTQKEVFSVWQALYNTVSAAINIV